ncbi:MAG TPA: tetratricopeptide repeat protein, partial [Rectinemataceae bacterium]
MESNRDPIRISMLCLAFLAAALARPGAQTSLPKVHPEYLSKLVNNRAEIERCIMVASPDALRGALAGLEQSKVIPEPEKLVLAEIVRGVSSILYPQPLPPKSASERISDAAKKGADASGAFYISPALNTVSKTDSLLLTQLVEASQGRIFPALEPSSSFLAELLPVLAIFRTKDSQVALAAFNYAERFSATAGHESAMTGLARARYALLSGDPAKAASVYSSLLDAYPDLWPAKLGLGSIALENGRAAEALAHLSPLEETRKADAAFMLPFALALYQNGRFAEAEPYVLALLDTEQAVPELFIIEAHLLLDRNEYAKALPFLDAYGRKKPQERMYLYLKTIHASSLPRKEEALRWARKAFQAFPSDPEIMVLLAGVLYA